MCVISKISYTFAVNFKYYQEMGYAQLSMSLPENLWFSINMDEDELMSEMRKEYGIKLYQTGKLTLNQASDFCGMDIYEFVSLLTLSGIPAIDYPMDELENEVKYLSIKMK